MRNLHIAVNSASSSRNFMNMLVFAAIFVFIAVSGIASGIATTYQLYGDVVKNFLVRISITQINDSMYVKFLPILFSCSVKVLLLGLFMLPEVCPVGILFSVPSLFLQSVLYGVSLCCGFMNDFSWILVVFCCLVLFDGTIMFLSMYCLHRYIISHFFDRIRGAKFGQVFSMAVTVYDGFPWKSCVVFLFCGIIEGAVIPFVIVSFFN